MGHHRRSENASLVLNMVARFGTREYALPCDQQLGPPIHVQAGRSKAIGQSFGPRSPSTMVKFESTTFARSWRHSPAEPLRQSCLPIHRSTSNLDLALTCSAPSSK
jgi:hypothetical protein